MKQIAVRDLASFVFRHGDLYPGGESVRVEAWEGTKAHASRQNQQLSKDPNYRKEVSVKLPVQLLSEEQWLQGRIDGLTLDAQKQPIVEEYKTSRRNKPTLRPVDEAQAWLYAGMLSTLDPQIESISTHTLYINTEGEELARYEHQLHPAAAKAFLAFALSCFGAYLERQDARHRRRTTWAQKLSFPLDQYRKNQRAMAGQVYRSLVEGQNLLLEAVTGSGKTLAVLFPALKAQALDEQFFFLTSRGRGADAALGAVDQLLAGDGHAPLRVVQITAKEKTCPLSEMTCDAALCPYAAGYYNKLPQALAALDKKAVADRQHLEQIANEHEVCPFELSLDSAISADIIVADYNYVFDPGVRLQRFINNGGQSLLIDESHQLFPRIADMLSVSLTLSQVQDALTDADAALKPALERLQQQIQAMAAVPPQALGDSADNIGAAMEYELPEDEQTVLVETLGAFIRACDTHMSSAAGNVAPAQQSRAEPSMGTQSLFGDAAESSPPQTYSGASKQDRDSLPESVLDVYFAALAWQRSEQWTEPENYRHIVGIGTPFGSRGDVVISKRCIDSSSYCAKVMAEHRSVIRFSGTLSPLALYQRLHGQVDSSPAEEKSQTQAVRVQTPFKPEQLKVLAVTDIDTFYQHRERGLPDLAALVNTLQRNRPGRYLIAMPSYAYLEQLAQYPQEYLEDAPHWLFQTRTMDDAEQRALLQRFAGMSEGVLGIVMGGVFAESVDLGSGALAGVIVVSLALPPKDLSKTLIQRHFDQVQGQGWGQRVAYLQPALSRIVQAAGRLVRSPNDRGVLCLVDPRFADPSLGDYFPQHWKVEQTRLSAVENHLKTFWSHDLPDQGA